MMRKSKISGKLKALKPSAKQEVWVFYSSEVEFPDAYALGIDYLHDSDIKTNIVDVRKHPELAEKHKILATPAILVKKGNEFHKFLGVKDGLTNLLSADLEGISILHSLGFREGRDLGKGLTAPKKRGKIEAELKSALIPQGISNFKLVEFDVNKHHAKISLSSDLAKRHKKSKAPECFDISALLGGIFTEVFDKGTHFREMKCMSQGNDFCEFETIKEGK
jgi:predicted hydrocarbon binding protein